MAWPADDTGHGRNLVQQRQQSSDVVAVAAGQRQRERDPLSSTRTWCLLSGGARSTGLGPLCSRAVPSMARWTPSPLRRQIAYQAALDLAAILIWTRR